MKKLEIISSAFENKKSIPNKYTCDGLNVNPPLDFLNVPPEARSCTLIVVDPDAPGKMWVHWVVFNIDPRTTKVKEDSVPLGAVQAVNDFGKAHYGGPCPPNGPHRYNFKLYALDQMLGVTEDVTLFELEKIMASHILGKAELTGIYARD